MIVKVWDVVGTECLDIVVKDILCNPNYSHIIVVPTGTYRYENTESGIKTFKVYAREFL